MSALPLKNIFLEVKGIIYGYNTFCYYGYIMVFFMVYIMVIYYGEFVEFVIGLNVNGLIRARTLNIHMYAYMSNMI